MGSCKGTDIFNNVAVTVETLVDLGRLSEPTGQQIMESLINGLILDDGWDTYEESIKEFEGTPFIVQAFKNCGYTLPQE